MCTDLQRWFKSDGSALLIPCRKCKRCIANRLTDFAGRCYAEALTSDSFVALTLTYGGGDDATKSQVLDYSDVQKLWKKLRSAGFKVRYVCAGEYGSKRGRAHWHCILYFRGKAPEFPPADTECQSWSYWTHGFTFVQQPDYIGMLYVLKYAVKDDGSERTTRNLALSKKPPLGARYWSTLARDRIKQGLPFSFKYTLPGARYKNGNAVRYYLRGKSAQLAYAAHRAEWAKIGRKGLPPASVDEYDALQKMLKQGADFVAAESSRIHDIRQALPWLAHPDFDRAILCANGDGYLVRLKSGLVYFSGLYKGKVRTWPARDLAEMVATSRGRRVQRAQRVLHTFPPF